MEPVFILLTNEGPDNTVHIAIVFFPFSAFFGCIKCFNMQQASSKASLTSSLMLSAMFAHS